MFKNRPLVQQVSILVSVPLLCELVFVGTLSYNLLSADVLLQQVDKARKFRQDTESIVHNVYQLARDTDSLKETQIDGGIDPNTLKNLKGSINGIEQSLQASHRDVPYADLNPVLDRISVPLERATRLMTFAVQAGEQGNMLGLFMLVRKNKDSFAKLKDSLFFSLDELITMQERAEEKYNRLVQEERVRRQNIVTLLMVGIPGNCIVALLLIMYFNRQIGDRFRVLMDNTRRLATNKPLNPPLLGNDEVAHLDRVFNDMAKALEAARHKERAIIENAIDVICSFDKEGRFVAVSPASDSLIGYLPEELRSKSLYDLVVGDDVEKTREAFDRIVENRTRGQFEIRLRRKSGSIVDVLWAMQWSASEDSMFCVAHDITERKEIERMKQEFVAMVSHDLRTPLTSIQGFLTLLSTGMYGDLSKTGAENLSIADSNISRLIALINDLLDIEKMESGKLKMELAQVPLANVFQRSVDAIAGFAEQQGIKLVVVPTQLYAFADSDRLVQVVINLVSNAIKFSPAGGTVRLEAGSADDLVEVRVMDQGRGVPAEFRDSIFERFQQVEASDAKVKGGSGLGLAICRAIVEGHNGIIGVDSEPGKGSTFWFRVPSAAVILQPDSQQATA